METEVIIWKHNTRNSFIEKLTDDEMAIFDADIRDAIEGVIEDWDGR